jgi:hypothetical protein
LKQDIVLLGRLDNGLNFYRFTYYDGAKAYVGVMAQEVQKVAPQAVRRGRDGYLRVFYEQLGLEFQTYKQWIVSGAPPDCRTFTALKAGMHEHPFMRRYHDHKLIRSFPVDVVTHSRDDSDVLAAHRDQRIGAGAL